MTINIEDTIGFALHNASYLFKSAIKNSFKQAGFDITPEEFVALNLIADSGIEQGDLVKRSLKDKTNITRLLDRLQKKDLIKRMEHHSSGRQQWIELTQQGSELRTKLVPIVQGVMAKASQGISNGDMETAKKVLNRLSNNLLP